MLMFPLGRRRQWYERFCSVNIKDTAQAWHQWCNYYWRQWRRKVNNVSHLSTCSSNYDETLDENKLGSTKIIKHQTTIVTSQIVQIGEFLFPVKVFLHCPPKCLFIHESIRGSLRCFPVPTKKIRNIHFKNFSDIILRIVRLTILLIQEQKSAEK